MSSLVSEDAVQVSDLLHRCRPRFATSHYMWPVTLKLTSNSPLICFQRCNFNSYTVSRTRLSPESSFASSVCVNKGLQVFISVLYRDRFHVSLICQVFPDISEREYRLWLKFPGSPEKKTRSETLLKFLVSDCVQIFSKRIRSQSLNVSSDV